MTHIYLHWSSASRLAQHLRGIADRIAFAPDGNAVVIDIPALAIKSDAGKWLYISEQAEAKGAAIVQAELVRRFGSPGVTGQ